jgi:hypothetical protein
MGELGNINCIALHGFCGMKRIPYLKAKKDETRNADANDTHEYRMGRRNKSYQEKYRTGRSIHS